MATLTANVIEQCLKTLETPPSMLLKATNIRQINPTRYACVCSDGTGKTVDAILASQISKQLAQGTMRLAEGDLIEVTNSNVQNVNDGIKLLVIEMSIRGSSGAAAAAAEPAVLQQVKQEQAADAAQQITPVKGGPVKSEAQPMEEDTKENMPATTPAAARSSPLPADAVAAAAAVVNATSAAAGSGSGSGAGVAGASPSAPPPVPHNTPLAAPRPPLPPQGTPSGAAATTPAAAARPSAAGSFMKTPGSTGSFQSAASPAGGATPSQPPMPTPVAESKPNVSPIAALNPYDSSWTIKAKITHKDQLRTFNKGSGGNVFGLELADAHGGQIRGTFWRQAADKFYAMLEEGKVYYFSRFSVKPANKAYSNIRNDYEINFDMRSEVEEAADQSSITISTHLNLVPLNQMMSHVGRKALVDVMGVVLEWGALGAVKRKTDGSDLARRDVTLGDKSCQSVVLTLWGQNAVGLEASAGQVLQVTSVRVSDYNGCSLTTVSRSAVSVNPETPECQALQSWYSGEGAGVTFTPLGQPGGRSGGGGGAGGAGGPQEVKLLGEVIPEEVPAEDKPVYGSVVAAVARISDTNMYYLADPATGRKVVAQDGRYWSEAEQKYVDQAQHRYSLQVQVLDSSRSAYVTMFDQQAEAIIGRSADDLAALANEGKDEQVKSLLKAAQWGEWELRVRARPHEYNGERKLRCQVVNVRQLDYQADSKRLLQLIHQAA